MMRVEQIIGIRAVDVEDLILLLDAQIDGLANLIPQPDQAGSGEGAQIVATGDEFSPFGKAGSEGVVTPCIALDDAVGLGRCQDAKGGRYG